MPVIGLSKVSRLVSKTFVWPFLSGKNCQSEDLINELLEKVSIEHFHILKLVCQPVHKGISQYHSDLG